MALRVSIESIYECLWTADEKKASLRIESIDMAAIALKSIVETWRAVLA